MNLPSLNDEEARLAAFPVARNKIFLAHAAVTALPHVVSQAVADFSRRASERDLDFAELTRDLNRTRALAARWIGARSDEIALLGPTSLGLSLFANGLPWKEGDEVVCYRDDYPANVYPWLDLQRHGVAIRYLEPDEPGAITPELVEAALTPRTRLVALASAHFLTGYRIDVDAIGRMLGERGVLFSLDAIQTIGAFSLSVEHVDFLSADAHKWMLGPMAIGIVYVKKKHFGLLRPTLLGAWNVISPEFITQEEIRFPDTAMRYEPGVLNVAGIYGMHAGLELLETYGIGNVSARLLAQKAHLINRLQPLEFTIHGPVDGPHASGATTFDHPEADMKALFAHLEANNVVASLRGNRQGRFFIRLSPHFYNTTAELDRVVDLLSSAL